MTLTVLEYLQLRGDHDIDVCDEYFDEVIAWCAPGPDDHDDIDEVFRLIAGAIPVTQIGHDTICANISGWVQEHMELLQKLCEDALYPMETADPCDNDSVLIGVKTVEGLIVGNFCDSDYAMVRAVLEKEAADICMGDQI